MWKDIEGYEGYYQINTNGEVKSLERIIVGRWGETLRKERMLKLVTSGKRYPMFTLCKDGKAISYTLHQLLAKTFIPNPYNKKCVNHIDNNGFNNSLSNLEWVTYSENTIHAWENGYNENVRESSRERMKKTYAGWNKGMKLSEWTNKIIQNEKSGRFESNKNR